MIPITLIAGIVCELIIGKYDNSKYIAIAFSVAIFIDKINSILLTIILGVEGLVKSYVSKSGVRLFPYYLLAYIMPPLYKP